MVTIDSGRRPATQLKRGSVKPVLSARGRATLLEFLPQQASDPLKPIIVFRKRRIIPTMKVDRKDEKHGPDMLTLPEKEPKKP
jgi:hypothetical protein